MKVCTHPKASVPFPGSTPSTYRVMAYCKFSCLAVTQRGITSVCDLVYAPPSLVSFPVAVAKYPPTKATSREKGFIWPNSRLHRPSLRGSQGRYLKQLVTSTIQSREREKQIQTRTALQPLAFSTHMYSSGPREWSRPLLVKLMMSTSSLAWSRQSPAANLIQTIPH